MQRSIWFAPRSWMVWLALAVLSLATLACGFEGGAFGSTPTPPPGRSAATLQALVGTATLAANLPGVSASGSNQPARGQTTEPVEAILITAPPPGQGMRGSIHIEGLVDPTFEQQLSVLIRDAKGTVIGTAHPMIQAEAGQRGKFSADVPLAANFPPQTGRIVVYSNSPRDGGVTHLASVDVQLNGANQVAAAPIDPNTPEGIIIVLPNPGAPLQGVAKVSAATMLGPDVVVEVHDASNKTVGLTRQKVDVSQLPAQVLAEVPLQVTQAGPGRILVYALNPRDGQAEHLSSIEVQLTP